MWALETGVICPRVQFCGKYMVSFSLSPRFDHFSERYEWPRVGALVAAAGVK